MPNCVSSTSPSIGRPPRARPATLVAVMIPVASATAAPHSAKNSAVRRSTKSIEELHLIASTATVRARQTGAGTAPVRRCRRQAGSVRGRSVLVFGQQVASVLQQRLAVEAALVHVGHPLAVDRRGGLDPVVGLGGTEPDDGVAAVGSGLAARRLALVPRLANLARQRGAAVVVDD